MPIKLSKRTEDEVAEQMREGDFRNADEVIHEGMALLRARQEFREAVFKGAAEADRGELLDGEGVFKEIKARLRQAKRRRRA
jgi:Arc/MetJ-type ribon-helix-helix transcriptional regulator